MFQVCTSVYYLEFTNSIVLGKCLETSRVFMLTKIDEITALLDAICDS